MKLNQEELESLTNQHLSEPFQKGLLKSVFLAHKLSLESCKAEFEDTEINNVLGYNRRAKFEGLLRAAAERHGYKSRVDTRKAKPWNVTEVSCGPITLTGAAVSKPCMMVEPSDYRKSLAEPNPNQLQLFSLAEPANRTLYGIVVHSKYRSLSLEKQKKYGHLPGSAYIAYPSCDFSNYVCEINLFDKFPEIVKKYTPQDWDEEAVVNYFYQARKIASA